MVQVRQSAEKTSRVVVLATDAWGTGGIERATRTLLYALADLYGPERVGVLSLWGGNEPLPCRVLWRGPPREEPGKVSWLAKARFALSAVRFAYCWRPGLVIIAYHPRLASVARLAGETMGARWAVCCHGLEVWKTLPWPVLSALRRAHLVIAPSRYTAEMLRRIHGIGAERLALLPHPLPVELAKGPDRVSVKGSRPVVLAVARLVPEHAYKGIDTLLVAWPKVLAAVPNAELMIVGDGPDRPRLEREAARPALHGRVRFAGRLSDDALARAYVEASVFALPVRTSVGHQAAGEGFGLVFLEAAAAGLPIVAGNGGAIPEVVRHNDTGLLVDPKSPEEVARAVSKLLCDPELACRMGEAGRRWIGQEFSYKRFRDQLSEFIERIRQGHTSQETPLRV